MSRSLHLILSSFDSGWRGARMGAGPRHLVASGLLDRLKADGWETTIMDLDPADPFPTETGTGFALQRLVASAVADALVSGSFPLILAGNCNTAAIGAVAGMGGDRLGVVWLDGHGDFNTPESTETGFLDGMGLAMTVGRCWRPMTARVPGFRPVAEQNVVLVGAQSLDAGEASEIAQSAMTHLTLNDVRHHGAGEALAMLGRRADAVYLHVDLDVQGSAQGRANALAPAEGFSPAEVREIAAQTMATLPVRVAAVTAYDPAVDLDGLMRSTAIELIATILAARP